MIVSEGGKYYNIRSMQKHHLIKKTVFGICIAMTAIFNVDLSAAIRITEFQQLNNFGPRGAEVPMIEFTVEAYNNDTETINSISFQNTAANIRFGDGIERVLLYVDSNNDNSFDASDTNIRILQFNGIPVGPRTFSNFSQTIASGNTATFFIVYDVSSAADLGSQVESTTMNVEVLGVSAVESSVDMTNDAPSNNFHMARLTGIETFQSEDESPTFVIPGDEDVAMLRFTVVAQGEDINEGDNDIQITVRNNGSNFVTNNSLSGVTAVHLYQDTFPNDEFDPLKNGSGVDVLLQTLRAEDGEIDSTSQVTFSSPFITDVNINGQGVAKRFYVVYNIGEDFVIDAETKIGARVTSFLGEGAESGLNLSLSTAQVPVDPYEAFVAGLTYGGLSSIVPTGSRFGSGTLIPMMEFSLLAYHTDVTVNTIILQNQGTIDFITDESSTDGINRIRLFEDTNGDGEFDGIDSTDTKIADLTLGNGNQDNRAVVTMNSVSGALTIPRFIDSQQGYPQTNEKRIFVVYNAGVTLTGTTDPDGNFSNVLIENVIGSSNVGLDVVTMNILGALPASASPDARVVFENTNIRIIESDDISPTFALRGQVKVPMVYLRLQASFDNGQSVSSSNVRIRNENQTFRGDNSGVSKVWLYEDINENRVLDDVDTLLASTRIQANSDLRFVDLFSVPFTNRDYNLMVLYDIGQEATTVTNAIRAQMSTIESDESVAILLGGEVPTPKESATISVLDKRLSIRLEGDNGVTAIAGDLRTTFNFKMFVTNTSSENIVLTNIRPAVLADTVSGIDITTEFIHEITSLAVILPHTIPSGQTATINFAADHRDPRTRGASILDVFAEYAVDYPGNMPDQTSQIARYQSSNNFRSGASQVIRLSMNHPEIETYPWDFPSYIEEVEVDFGGISSTFNHGNVLQTGSNILIHLQNQGQTIDDGSIVIQRNGIPLVRRTTQGSLGSDTYSYNTQTGIIRIDDLGSDLNGTVLLTMEDLQGNTLEPTSLQYKLNTVTAGISDLLVYPSPFQVGEEDLKVGYNLTKNGLTVNLHIYNYLGQLVYTSSGISNDLGYNTVEINAYEGFLKSGMYLVRVMATDPLDDNNDTNTVFDTTRFAVY